MLAVAIIALLAPPAQAQDGFDAHGFVSGPVEGDARDPVGWVRPGVFAPGDVYVAALAEYARNPLVEVTTSELSGDLLRRGRLRDLGTLDLAAGVAVHERLRLDLALPVFLVSSGYDGVQGPVPGDLRAAATAVLVAPTNPSGVGLGFSTWADLPTGDASRLLGAPGIGGGARTAVTVEAGRFTANGQVGLAVSGTSAVPNAPAGEALLFGLGATAKVSERVALGLEASGRAALRKSLSLGSGSPAEALLSLRVADPSGATVLVGLGRAITPGAGAAAVRAFVGVGFGHAASRRPEDLDAIGTLLVADACPREPETRNGYRDDDGCPDALGTVQPRVTWEGRSRPGAHLVITGLEQGMDGPYRPEDPPLQVVPGAHLVARAASDGCLSGEASLDVVEGDNVLEVPLSRVLGARVTVAVEDMHIHTVAGATVTWLSETPLCVPGDVLAVDGEGRATAQIGVGEHQLVVEAEGYEMAVDTFTFAEGDDRTLTVTLTPVPGATPEPAQETP